MDKILIIGSGFVGANLAILAKNNFNVHLTYHNTPVASNMCDNTSHLDITDQRQIGELVKKIAPDIIVNTAAVSSPYICAQDKSVCEMINVAGTENIAKAASDCSARLIHLSSDLVYNGSGSYYKETDAAEPSCLYGRTKLNSEHAVAANCQSFCVLRSALVFGKNVSGQKRFIDTIIDKLKNRQQPELFSNEYRNMIYVGDLCSIILEMAKQKDFSGILNAGGPERITRYEFAVKLAETFELDATLLKPIKVDQALFNDHRPEDCSMNTDKLCELVERKPMTPKDALELIKSTWQ